MFLNTKEICIELIEAHLKKMNFIMNGDYEIPNNHFSQFQIFSKQLEKYIKQDKTIAVLSAFPIYLFDYFGYQRIQKFIKPT